MIPTAEAIWSFIFEVAPEYMQLLFSKISSLDESEVSHLVPFLRQLGCRFFFLVIVIKLTVEFHWTCGAVLSDPHVYGMLATYVGGPRTEIHQTEKDHAKTEINSV